MFRGSILALLIGVGQLGAGTPALAQDNPNPVQTRDTRSGVGIGALAGIARSSLRFDGSELTDQEPGTGGLLGIWFGGNRNGRVGFMGELNYVVKKSTLGASEGSLTYLEIPALFRINVVSRSGGGASAYALVGPVVDIKLTASEDGEDVSDFYNGFDVGVMAGAGAEVNRIGFEVRGSWGQRSILPAGEDSEKVKIFTLQFLAKYRFN